jgi:hypothetical protein
MIFAEILLLYFALGRFDPLLHLAVGSQILSDLTAATCSGEPNITAT